MLQFPVCRQQDIEASGLAVQKSQANRNAEIDQCCALVGLAVQKSQANRNEPSEALIRSTGLAVQKSQANRNGRKG